MPSTDIKKLNLDDFVQEVVTAAKAQDHLRILCLKIQGAFPLDVNNSSELNAYYYLAYQNELDAVRFLAQFHALTGTASLQFISGLAFAGLKEPLYAYLNFGKEALSKKNQNDNEKVQQYAKQVNTAAMRAAEKNFIDIMDHVLTLIPKALHDYPRLVIAAVCGGNLQLVDKLLENIPEERRNYREIVAVAEKYRHFEIALKYRLIAKLNPATDAAPVPLAQMPSALVGLKSATPSTSTTVKIPAARRTLSILLNKLAEGNFTGAVMLAKFLGKKAVDDLIPQFAPFRKQYAPLSVKNTLRAATKSTSDSTQRQAVNSTKNLNRWAIEAAKAGNSLLTHTHLSEIEDIQERDYQGAAAIAQQNQHDTLVDSLNERFGALQFTSRAQEVVLQMMHMPPAATNIPLASGMKKR